jgi:dephospho-CoA kinase
MSNTVVGFSGGIASGKSSLSTAVAQAIRWPRTSFGGYVRTIAAQRGLEPTRENCQAIGEERIEADIHGFCKNVLAEASWSPGEPLVIDGIRHLEVADLLSGMVRPTDFVLVFVELPRAEREARLKNRDDESQPLELFEQHSTEVQVSELRARANIVVDGDRPVEQLADEVVRFLTSRNQRPE